MPYTIAVGSCVCCNQPFTFNLQRVPSVILNAEAAEATGRPQCSRQPLCRSCVAKLNTIRARLGLPLITIQPDAYGPTEEGEHP